MACHCASIASSTDAEIDTIAATKLAAVQLGEEVAHQYPSELSGGMLKRAALARALVLDPELLFLDEPTAGLDPQSAAGIDALVRELCEKFGLTIVMITHDLDTLWQVADRVAVLADGTVQGVGSMAELSKMDKPGIQAFFEGPRSRAAQAQTHDSGRIGHQGAIIETKVNYALVGAFVLALGAALVAGALWLAAGGAWQKKYDTYLAVEDESVAGLNLDAPVKYNGVDVGKVQAIHLDRINPQRVNLLFSIERGTPIKEDTIAVLKTQGLTGIAYVELNGGTVGIAPSADSTGCRLPADSHVAFSGCTSGKCIDQCAGQAGQYVQQHQCDAECGEPGGTAQCAVGYGHRGTHRGSAQRQH